MQTDHCERVLRTTGHSLVVAGGRTDGATFPERALEHSNDFACILTVRMRRGHTDRKIIGSPEGRKGVLRALTCAAERATPYGNHNRRKRSRATILKI